MILLLCLVLAWYMPLAGDRVFGAIEEFGTRLAKRKHLVLISIAAAAILIRLSLLWAIPIPVPHVHDEFSYLLGADTFAHGRLTNPPHPMWIFFDTFHVNQHPAYISKYPPAQAAALALGQLFGHPWIGVLLSVGAMCAAILWMLQGWLPPQWALLGGVLVLLRLGLFSYWMNSYWGGAVAAIGGALVVGAMPRIFRFLRLRDALLLGIGVAILANSRPLEGLIFCLPVVLVLLIWVCDKRSPSFRVTLPRLILPFCAVMLFCGVFIGYYNWRGTGSPFVFPYAVNERTYVTTPTFFWQKARPPIQYSNPQFEAYYNGWLRTYWSQRKVDSARNAVRHAASVVMNIAYYFFWPELCVPLIFLPGILLDRRVRFLVLQAALCFLGFLLTPWFLAHYAAPLTATLFALLIQAIRHLRRWKHSGRPVGVGFSRVVILFALLLAPYHRAPASIVPVTPPEFEYRTRFEKQLNTSADEHLLVVRYSSKHDPAREWVFNAADIDHAKIVWAREIPGVDIHPLLDYFRGRRVWLVEPDAIPPRITPYPETSAQ